MSDIEGAITELVRVALARKLYEGTPVDVAVARHESAHALSAWATRAPALREVSVNWSGGGETRNNAPKPAGIAEPRAAVFERLRREHPVELAAVIRRQVVTIYAGRAADEHGPGRQDPSCSQDDMDQAAYLAEATVGAEERDRFLAPLRAAATALIADGWQTICELASLLSYERKLPGAFLEAWFEERAAARSLRDRWGAMFASSVESAA
jgi:hypothetical protein